MILLEQLQLNVPSAVIAYFFPLLIVGCFLISFRPWLHAKWYVVVSVYVLSIVTYTIARSASQPADAALIGGILAPALYSFLFVCFGLVRALRVPYGYRMQHSVRSIRRPNQMLRLVKGAVGGCAGGITGSSLGVLFSFLLIILFPLFSSHQFFSWQYIKTFPNLINGNILIFGTTGTSLGALTGWGCINQKQLGDKILIGLTILAFVIVAALKRILKYFSIRKNP